jgi:hypothetical protein
MALGHSTTQSASNEDRIPVLLVPRDCVAIYKNIIPRLIEKPITAAPTARP